MYIIAGTLWSLGSWIQIGRDKAIEVLRVDHGLAGGILANVHQPRNMGCCGKKKVLMIMTSICACASFAFLCFAVATDYWLFAIERRLEPNGSTVEMHTYTGLWRKCVLDAGEHHKKKNCSYINYFTHMDRDGLGPTESILLSMRRSTLFPLISLLILLVGEIVCFLGHCNHKKKIMTFVAGILFVVGGLCTLVGIILYIGAITEEVGNKPKSTLDKPKFQYSYGTSFIMTISSFIVSELTGVLSVYLYISRHKHAYRKKQERLTMLDANERQPQARYRRSRSHSHDRSREHSRDNSPSHSDTYYTYTPVSDTSKEMSNYTLTRDPSRHTISTAADTHPCKDHPGGGPGHHHRSEPRVMADHRIGGDPRAMVVDHRGVDPRALVDHRSMADHRGMHDHRGSADTLDTYARRTTPV